MEPKRKIEVRGLQSTQYSGFRLKDTYSGLACSVFDESFGHRASIAPELLTEIIMSVLKLASRRPGTPIDLTTRPRSRFHMQMAPLQDPLITCELSPPVNARAITRNKDGAWLCLEEQRCINRAWGTLQTQMSPSSCPLTTCRLSITIAVTEEHVGLNIDRIHERWLRAWISIRPSMRLLSRNFQNYKHKHKRR